MSTSMPPRDREHCERGQKGLKSQMVGRSAPKRMFSAHKIVFGPLNPQKLWLPAQDWASGHFVTKGRRTHAFQSLLEVTLAVSCC